MKSKLMKAATAAMLVLALAGCATTSKKSPEESVKDAVDGWKAALVANDQAKLMSFYSESFNNSELGDKASLGEKLKGYREQGIFNGLEVDTAYTKITVDKEKATAYPIDLKSSMGALSIQLNFAHEKGGWLIIGSDNG